MENQRIIAVGLLTQKDVSLLGATFDRLWPVQGATDFAELLDAIDAADRRLREPESSDAT